MATSQAEPRGWLSSSCSRPSQAMLGFVMLAATVFSFIYVVFVFRDLSGGQFGPLLLSALAFKTFVEVSASYYGFALLFTAGSYICGKAYESPSITLKSFPAVAVVYLCCEDLNESALQSLATLQYRGKLHIVVHDDSRSEPSRKHVDLAVARLRETTEHEIVLLRRNERIGGKAGATNYVLERIACLAEYALICDNDSTILNPLTIELALSHFVDPALAIVQCRNVAVTKTESCRVNQLLAPSIDAFNVFLTTNARFGWQPFVGHNALLKLESVRSVGGFTPGFFSDDLDLTVRLNLAGYRVVYAPSIAIGEEHPPSYESFRRRTYKWAYGCVQTLKAHSSNVLRSRQFNWAEKFSFFYFTGFYVVQSLLLLYLTVTFLLLPVLLQGRSANGSLALFAGTIIIMVTYAPVLAYFARERKASEWLGTVLMCGLVYGSADFPSARGVLDCLFNLPRDWTPTNLRPDVHPQWPYLAECAFGIALLITPVMAHSTAIYLPAFYLFAGKYLGAPTLSILYDDERAVVQPTRRSFRFAQRVLPLLLIAFILLAPRVAAQPDSNSRVEVRGHSILVNGAPFLVKGMHYGPWRPGTGPNKNYPYPSRADIESDLKLIRSLNVNTILVVDPPDYLLDAAQEYHLKVLYEFSVGWWTLGTDKDTQIRQHILQRVAEAKDSPALLGWVLGNEIPNSVVVTRGSGAVTSGLHNLYLAVKQVDPNHPVTYSNWPITKNLDLSFLDIISFNVYPLWPPDVVAQGYGNYIKNVLMPIAGTKPLLITEFGADSLEAGDDGQARLIRSSWKGLTGAGACGGVVFEFADEWWKNYDNPIRTGDWWDRQAAPSDEKTHDLDPEEYYGVFTGYRQPRPAAEAVKEMFAPPRLSWSVLLPRLIVGLMILLALLAWALSRHRTQKKRARRAALPRRSSDEVHQ